MIVTISNATGTGTQRVFLSKAFLLSEIFAKTASNIFLVRSLCSYLYRLAK